MKAVFRIQPVLQMLILSLLSVSALAANERASDSQIEQYMELSGLVEVIESVPVQIDAVSNQRLMVSDNPEVEKAVLKNLSDAWNSQALLVAVASHIQQHAAASDIARLLEWTRSPLATKMKAAELETNSPHFQEDFMRYIAGLQSSPPSPDTMKAVRRLVVATDMVDQMAETYVQITKVMVTSMVEAEGNANSEMIAGIENEMDSMKAMLLPQLNEQAMLMSYYMYRNISAKELAQYTDFYETTLGKTELKLTYDAINLAMSIWAKQAAKAIVEEAR